MDDSKGKRKGGGSRSGTTRPPAAKPARKRSRPPAAEVETAEGVAAAAAESSEHARRPAPRRGRADTVRADGRAASVSPEERRAMIAERAYFRAERRGFVGGDPVADWLEGEKEVDGLLSQGAPRV